MNKHIIFLLFLVTTSTLVWTVPTCRQILNQNKDSGVEQLGLTHLRNSQSTATKEWVKAQNKSTLDSLGIGENGKNLELMKLLLEQTKNRSPNNPAPFVETQHGQMMIKAGNLIIKSNEAEERVLVPSFIDQLNRKNAASEFKLSPDGNRVAVSMVFHGNDQNFWSVYDIKSGEKIAGPFEVRLNDFSFSHDSNSIYYTKWPSLNEAATGVLYANNYVFNLQTHQQNIIFVPPARDSREIFTIESFEKNGRVYYVAARTQGGAEVPISIHIGERGQAQEKLKEFQVGEFKWKTLIPSKRERLGKLIGIKNGEIFLRTSEEANFFELIALNPLTGEKRKIVPEIKGSVLTLSQIIGDRIYNQYLNSETHENYLVVYNLKGHSLARYDFSEFNIPKTGTLSPIVGVRQSHNLYFVYHDTLLPHATFVINQETLKLQMIASKNVNFNTSKVNYQLLSTKSLDGTQVPIKLYTRKDQEKPRFVYVFYYGFIGVTQQPQWNRKFQHMLDLGGAVAIVSPRGGGLKGRDWQLEGKKSETARIEDALSAGRYLKNLLGGAPLLASGRSFGGLLTAQLLVMASKEKVFDAYSSTVPVTDLNEFLTHGLFGRMAGDDFDIPRDSNGSVIHQEAFYKKLKRMSPLSQLESIQIEDMKPVLFSSGGSDDRVGEAQARYLTEALQIKFPGLKDKILLYEDPETGHSSRSEDLREALFVAKTFGIDPSELRFLTNE